MNEVNILIVDDNYEKIGLIANHLTGFEHIKLDTKNNVRDAISYLRDNKCDILVADIVLPKILGEQPSDSSGIELINMILNNNNTKAPIYIIAATSHIETHIKYKETLANLGLPFILTDSSSNILKSVITQKVKHCEKIKLNSPYNDEPNNTNRIKDTDSITLKWLLENVKLSQWIALIGVLAGIFMFGVQFGQTDLYKSIKGNSIATPEKLSKKES
ncbi:response regulator [Shewanella marisflavi]|uniref:response regulator n=1 Tax=Shewanella marisflavi TaxID=260364 RepID=UPI003AAA690D